MMRPRRWWQRLVRARTVRCVVVVSACVLVPSGSARAQIVQGTVVERGGAARVSGAIVTLIDSLNRSVARALSREQGEYRLVAPAFGQYQLRILRIGYAPSLIGPFVLRAGETLTQEVAITGQPVSLEALHVSAARQCLIRPDSTQAAFVVWEEARKALTAALLTQTTRPMVHLRRYERWLDARNLAVQREEQHEEHGETSQPFVSVPAETLFARGFVRRDETGTTYSAPDAAVLLSERFADSHCLRLVARTQDAEEQLGVEFSPVESHEDASDIQGTFWVARRGAELRALEFRYTNLPAVAEEARAGGEMDFLRLPDGAWMVGRWQIRMPVLRVREGSTLADAGAMGGAVRLQTRRVNVLAAIQAVGGEVLDVARGGRIIWSRKLAVLTMRLVDSAANFPLRMIPGTVEGTERLITTDSAGTATISGLLPGTYAISFQLPLLDSLGLGRYRASVVVDEGAPTLATIRAPSRGSVFLSACGVDFVPAEEAVLSGVVTDSVSGTPVPHAAVVAVWQSRFARLRGGYTFSTERKQVSTDDAGRFRICGVSRNTTVLVSAGRSAPSGVASKVRVDEEDSVKKLRLVLGTP